MLRICLQDPAELGDQGTSGSLRIYNQQDGGPGSQGHIIAGRLQLQSSQPIINSHDSLQYRMTVSAACKDLCSPFRAAEKGIQIPSPDSQDPVMEHGIDIIRTAFEGRNICSPLPEQLKKPAGNQSFSASACRRCDHYPVDPTLFPHFLLPEQSLSLLWYSLSSLHDRLPGALPHRS